MVEKRTIKLHSRGIETYKLPMVPNFIRRVSDDFPVPYGELSDAQIRKVAKAWGDALLGRAAEQRKNETTFD